MFKMPMQIGPSREDDALTPTSQGSAGCDVRKETLSPAKHTWLAAHLSQLDVKGKII